MQLETIKIKHKSGYCLINKADFDESRHQLYEETEFKIPQTPDDVSLGPCRETAGQRSDRWSNSKDISEAKTVINLNTADKKTLTSLPGIGARTAAEIIEARPFASLKEAIAQFKVLEELPVEV